VLWRQVSDAVTAREMLRDILPALVDTYGQAAGALAADWYDEARDEAGVRGRFRALVADVPDPGADALAGWACLRCSRRNRTGRRLVTLLRAGCSGVSPT
jgi:hypothetical protein